MMLVIGLSGGIACGKSTVSKLLKSRGIPIIDADVIARAVVEPGKRAHSKIVSCFGSSILLPDGNIDRAKLGSIIFQDETKRKLLNSIIHPAVRWRMFCEVLSYWFCGEQACVLDVPLLIESGIWKWVGMVIIVYCSPELQMERLTARDKMSASAAQDRLAAQLPLADKVAYADIVVDNSGSLPDLEHQVNDVVRRIRVEVGWMWRLSWLFPPLGLLSAGWYLLSRRRRFARRSPLAK